MRLYVRCKLQNFCCSVNVHSYIITTCNDISVLGACTRVFHAGRLGRYLRVIKIKPVLIRTVINNFQSTTRCLKLIIYVNNVPIKSIASKRIEVADTFTVFMVFGSTHILNL